MTIYFFQLYPLFVNIELFFLKNVVNKYIWDSISYIVFNRCFQVKIWQVKKDGGSTSPTHITWSL